MREEVCALSQLRSKSCNNNQQLKHLIAHYEVVSGDKSVIDASVALQEALISQNQSLKNLLNATPSGELVLFSTMIVDYRYYFR